MSPADWDAWRDKMRARHQNGNGHGRSLGQEARRPDTFHRYAPAIARWQHVTGRPAPEPTDDDGQLAAPFVEWMMGWPADWTHGTRAQRLAQCGNGVVPQQAAHAYRQLIDRLEQP